MVCNTLSPGCKNVCFNEFSPISPIRYWFFQILAVSLASIIFSIYTTHKLALVTRAIRQKKRWIAKEKLKAIELKEQRRSAKEGDETKKVVEKKAEPKEEKKDDKDEEVVATKLQTDHPPKLFLAYFFMVFMRLVIEVGFMVGQYFLYTYKFVVPELWQCSHWPCPNVVDCFVSRPKEKTIMICTFYVTGCIMVVLNVIELYHIGGNVGKAWSNRSNDITKEVFGESAGPNFEAPGGMRHWVPGAEGMYQQYPSGYPAAVGIPTLYTSYGRSRRKGRKSGLPKNRFGGDEYYY
uniref:gap junction gamma-1 protein-like n=1 Tax=Ciona intestinalis TaxID=7719 RepID=UPI0005215D70|nr:gap junction gamma-1 protein-like [Ciona intestinalis]|eukprot:XP_018672532.1 gap junction gamma-1 protein-like [Ciona intestinalis]